MRTPAVMIVGMVLGPCGLLLNLVTTLAPAWREVRAIQNQQVDTVQHQGIWDICKEQESTHIRQCGIDDNKYFQAQVVQVAQGLMVVSLVVTALGLVVASLGVRCWQDIPQYTLAGAGGLVLFASGVLSLIAVSWYTNLIYTLQAPGEDIKVGYCLVLGYLGSCLEIIGGFSLALSFTESYKKYRDRKKHPPPARSFSIHQIDVLEPGYSSRYAGKSGRDWVAETTCPSIYSLDLGEKRDKRYHPDRKLNTGYSTQNLNWQAGSRNANHNSNSRTAQSCYSNPADVTEDERLARPRSHQSSLPCDSDLL